MDIRGAIFKVDNDDDEAWAEEVASVSGSARGRTLTRDSDSVEDRRKNFRSATYAYSSDRTTIEDMADRYFRHRLLVFENCFCWNETGKLEKRFRAYFNLEPAHSVIPN